MTRRKPSKTPRTTISVADDLIDEFDELRRWVEAGQISLSRYLITAALLCKRAGIDDPALAQIDNLLWGEMGDPGLWEPETTAEPSKNGKVTMNADALDALDKLF